MSIFAKLRNLARYGIITDIDPYDLPPEAFSFGYNVRFRNGSVSRAPVYRDVRALTASTEPRFVFAANGSSTQDQTYVGHMNGRVFLTSSALETDYSVAGYVNNVVEATWSSTRLADCLYVNRSDRAPWVLTPGSGQFVVLPNWPASTIATLLRSCGGALVALNVNWMGTQYPTGVMTSAFAQVGSVPTSWDFTIPSTNATENILAEMEGGIVDACTLGNNLVIYGHNSSWLMQKTSAFEIFDYYKLPFQKGSLNANCSVEVGAINYVFGPDDIWKHDGVSEESICHGRVKEFIFSTLDLTQTARCFVFHNPVLKEIYFCYVSADRGTKFNRLNVTGCNKQAVYNYIDDTWTFDDVPSCFSAAYCNLNTSQTWASMTATWSTAGGSWFSYEDPYRRTPAYVGDTNSTYGLTAQLYSYDLYASATLSAYNVDINANGPVHLERDGIDLDQIDGVNLPDYKLVNSIYPLARLDPQPNTTLGIQFGSADYYGQTAVFDDPAGVQTFDGNTNYKLDYNAAGRYLSIKLDYNDYTTVYISGFDFEVDTTGHR